ncbi:hypothetical protein IC229_14190 [Spirosoma sp. BT702]|uniref:Uncharacterized protein n=1 Tax=Spirosoma profusum TaxID=2771354 RepID=A0A926XWB3_9BACT|nr:DUF5990 family protein [Spirosoma profusum]MBD2701797.1 hypothetical protein [Spirosoma profusum]
MEQELRLQIVLEKPTPGVDFGLQKGSGNAYETIQTQRSAGADLSFTCTARVKSDSFNKESPVLLGPFVQGPPDSRFVYLDIGKTAGQHDTEWSRRLKIPLTGISWEMIHQLGENPGQMLVTQVPGTGKDGSPNCATVKPFAGWRIS